MRLTKTLYGHAMAAFALFFFAGLRPVMAEMATDSTGKDTTKYTTFKELPLKPQRSIHFGTTEATWTSLDVSPDGKTIVFDMMGDLYTLPIGGGQATQLTKGISF